MKHRRFVNHLPARLSVGLGVPMVGTFLAIVPLVKYRNRLPTSVASHWGTSRVPNDSMSRRGFELSILAMLGVGAALLIGLSTRRAVAKQTAFIAAALGSAMVAMAVLVSVTTIVANLDVGSYQDARLPNWFMVALIVGLPSIVAGTTWLTSGFAESARAADSSTAAYPLSPTERATWMGTATSKIFRVVPLARITVVVGGRGLSVGFGPFQWPKVRIPLDRIEHVSCIDVRPTQWGGWGYRGSLTVMRQAAVVLRGGSGIRLDLKGNKTFVVTVDDAEVGASVLEALRLRAC